MIYLLFYEIVERINHFRQGVPCRKKPLIHIGMMKIGTVKGSCIHALIDGLNEIESNRYRLFVETTQFPVAIFKFGFWLRCDDHTGNAVVFSYQSENEKKQFFQ